MSPKGRFRIGYIVFAVCLIYFIATFINQQRLLSAGQRSLKTLEERIDEETKENARLRSELELIGTDEYIERIAREKLGMIKKDERIFEDVNK